MADEEQLAILRQGVEAWNAWRGEHPKIHVDFTDANFAFTNLAGANLSGAGLGGADFAGAKLGRANLSFANLDPTNLRGADLARADFTGARLRGVNFAGAVLFETIFVDIDLSGCSALDTCLHYGPSFIDPRTLQRSGPLPLAFLRGVGLPDNLLIDYLPSLPNQAIRRYSCFISYSSADKDFARRLHTDLQGKGVRCWFAPEDMKFGDRIEATIDTAIRLRGKVLLVLSATSVTSAWMRKEVRTALAKERHKRAVLFPVRIDDSVMDTTEQWADDIRSTRHIGDFTRWKEHDAYQKALERLLRDLRVERA